MYTYSWVQKTLYFINWVECNYCMFRFLFYILLYNVSNLNQQNDDDGPLEIGGFHSTI